MKLKLRKSIDLPTYTLGERGNCGISLKYGFLILPNLGYCFTNVLDITTSSLSLNYINPKNKKRLDFIIKLHNEGMTNEMIIEILKSKGIKRRNKNDNYSVKDVFMCITKLKKREERIKDIKYKLGKWKLWREY